MLNKAPFPFDKMCSSYWSRLLLKQSVHRDGGMELSGIAVPGQAIGSDKRKLYGFPASGFFRKTVHFPSQFRIVFFVH